MAKKQLNKMVILPLFLAGVTLASAGVLTGVHLLTKPFIETNELNKKYEGYKQILEIENFDDMKTLELAPALNSAGIKLKQEFYIGGTSAGVVYDGEIRGWESGLIFQVGFKNNVYAGFNLISSNETPGIGADYLRLVHDRIKGIPIDEPVLIDNDGSYTGVTAPVTGGPLKVILELCAADYAGEEIVEETFIDHLNDAMNRKDLKSHATLELSQTLTDAKVLNKYEVFTSSDASGDAVGIVYEASIKGYKDDLHFVVGFSGDAYAGYKTISSNETPGLGADYLATVNDELKGVKVGDPILTDTSMATVTVTRNALKGILEIIALDYIEGGGN